MKSIQTTVTNHCGGNAVNTKNAKNMQREQELGFVQWSQQHLFFKWSKLCPRRENGSVRSDTKQPILSPHSWN